MIAGFCAVTLRQVAAFPGQEVGCLEIWIFVEHVLLQAFEHTRTLFSSYLGGSLKYFIFSSLFGEMIQFDVFFSIGLKPPTSSLRHCNIQQMY